MNDWSYLVSILIFPEFFLRLFDIALLSLLKQTQFLAEFSLQDNPFCKLPIFVVPTKGEDVSEMKVKIEIKSSKVLHTVGNGLEICFIFKYFDYFFA